MKTIKKLALKMDDFGSDYGLVFDRSVIRNTCQKLSVELKGYEVHFSVKSFPHPEFLREIAPFVHGWDVSTASELDLIRPLLTANKSLWLTNSSTAILAEALKLTSAPYFTLDHTTDLTFSFPESVNLGIRLDPYSLLDRGHSRYGFTLSQLDGLPGTLKSRIKYLHAHCPGMISGSELKGMRDAMEKLLPQFPKVSLINLGGGLTSANIDSFEMLQDIYPSPRLAIEPGRWFSEASGSAFTKIGSIFEKSGDLYLVSSLSAEAHLKWGRGMTYTFINQSKEVIHPYKRLIYSSSNALETDRIVMKQTPGSLALSPGDWLVIEGVPGYAVAWNHEFNGVPKAPVYFIE